MFLFPIIHGLVCSLFKKCDLAWCCLRQSNGTYQRQNKNIQFRVQTVSVYNAHWKLKWISDQYNLNQFLNRNSADLLNLHLYFGSSLHSVAQFSLAGFSTLEMVCVTNGWETVLSALSQIQICGRCTLKKTKQKTLVANKEAQPLLLKSIL